MTREIDLYKIGTEPSELRQGILDLRADFDSHNHDGSNSSSFRTLSVETLSARVIAIKKNSFTKDTGGIWMGLVGDVLKLNLGDATNFLKWDGSAITFSGDISGGSLNINDKAIIDSDGNATFVGVTSLNMKVYTCFETKARFIDTVSNSGTSVFGNQGMTMATGTTSTSHVRMLWWITGTVFNNNPTFTCSLLCLNNFLSGDGIGFIGLGNPTISGSGFTETGTNYCGFQIKKSSGVTTVIASQCDGGGSVTFTGTLRTLVDGDYLELFIKKNGTTSIDYYTRLNGGALSAVSTLSATLPSGSDTHIQFSVSNKAGTDEFKIQLQTAAYEH